MTRKEKGQFPYRFKTKEELVSEFGISNWKSAVWWNSNGRMDYLFGIVFPYTEHTHSERYYIGNVSINSWLITRRALTDNELYRPTISYKKRKII